MEMLAKAISITATAFEDKLDRGGQPYILHCLTVMERVGKITQKNSEAMQAAVMHDLIEDCPEWTIERLRHEGFSLQTCSWVWGMTHADTEPYDEYIERVGRDPVLRIIKMSDLKHNSDITRLKGTTPKDMARLEKYCHAYNYLKDL